MKICFVLVCVVCLLPGWAVGALQRGEVSLKQVPVPQPHSQPEYTLDASTDPGSWLKQAPGLHVAVGSTDELYLRCEPPQLKRETKVWKGRGWKGERLNAQILVWSTEAQEQIHFLVSGLRNIKGQVIEKAGIKCHLVRYVLSNLPYGAEGFSCDSTNNAAYLMPDRMEAFERFDLPARTIRPVWLSMDIPASADPGEYTGAIQVNSSKDSVTLQVQVDVQPMILPEPSRWKFRLDLWQNPWVVASYFQVTPWSEEHKTLLRAHLKLYADAGGKNITTYTVQSPWSDNSYVLEGTMISWTKTTMGSWKFDYSTFDQYVELALESGVNGAITIYTPVPWGHRFRYLDEKSGNYLDEQWPPQSGQFKSFWNPFLDDLKDHLSKKGWLQKTYLGINENPLENTLAAAKVIRAHASDWKITYAGDWHPELSSVIDDYSVVMGHEPSQRELQERAAKGFTTTYYVCCNPARPNNFVFSVPVEGRFMGWYAAARGYNGFLRWAYDAWPADPNRDARHTLWPAGDCFLVYPGGNSSIRFEKLREGIVDYEKILLLKERAVRSSAGNGPELITELEHHLKTFYNELGGAQPQPEVSNVAGAVQSGKEMIERLTRDLSK